MILVYIWALPILIWAYVFIKLLFKPEAVIVPLVEKVDNLTKTMMGTLTRQRASQLSEAEARKLYGDVEVDRFTKRCDREDRDALQ